VVIITYRIAIMKITKKQLRRIIQEAVESYVGPRVPNDMMNRIDALWRGDLQDHLYDIVDAIESGDPDYTIEMLKLNLQDAERMERQ
tara:strand:- start:191 stop:451 length:261 start_codon:yes stop_codon:yes gene_type:complete